MSDRLLEGRFRLLAPLGGQAGQVWQAADQQTGQPVAVKLYHGRPAPDPATLPRHPNVVSTFSGGIHEGVPYVVMELVDGVSLATVLEEGPLDRDDAVRVAAGVSVALHAAHSTGVVHGNLKASNVLIAEQGVVKVGDFAGHGDPREDMYSLGLMMEAMSGHRDPVVERLLSRDPYTPAQLHEILTGQPLPDAGAETEAEAEIEAEAAERDGEEPGRPKLLRLAVITGAVTLVLVIAVCAWFLSPSSPPDTQAGNSSGEVPSSPVEEASAEPSLTETPSTEAAAAPVGSGVGAVKAVIANQLKAGQIHPDAAAALNIKLDEIGRFLARGQTKQANDRIAAFKAQLAEQRRTGKVTAEGYDAILASVNRLSA